jgi:hypothetical protein
VRFLTRIAILLESADIWRVEATSEKNAIREFLRFSLLTAVCVSVYRGGVKSVARPGREQPTATEGFEFRTFYL